MAYFLLTNLLLDALKLAAHAGKAITRVQAHLVQLPLRTNRERCFEVWQQQV